MKPLAGVVPVIPTPFTKDESIATLAGCSAASAWTAEAATGIDEATFRRLKHQLEVAEDSTTHPH